MRSLTKSLVSFLKKEDGPTAVEYAVMLALIIVVCIAAITTLGSNANETFSFVGSSIKPLSNRASTRDRPMSPARMPARCRRAADLACVTPITTHLEIPNAQPDQEPGCRS